MGIMDELQVALRPSNPAAAGYVVRNGSGSLPGEIKFGQGLRLEFVLEIKCLNG